MANQNHLAVLKKGVAAWNEWRKKNPEIQPDLFKANLRLANLSMANLSGANLRMTDLRGAYLRVANLNMADLRGANLRVADLRGANLKEVKNLRREQLEKA